MGSLPYAHQTACWSGTYDLIRNMASIHYDDALPAFHAAGQRAHERQPSRKGAPTSPHAPMDSVTGCCRSSATSYSLSASVPFRYLRVPGWCGIRREPCPRCLGHCWIPACRGMRHTAGLTVLGLLTTSALRWDPQAWPPKNMCPKPDATLQRSRAVHLTAGPARRTQQEAAHLGTTTMTR